MTNIYLCFSYLETLNITQSFERFKKTILSIFSCSSHDLFKHSGQIFDVFQKVYQFRDLAIVYPFETKISDELTNLPPFLFKQFTKASGEMA